MKKRNNRLSGTIVLAMLMIIFGWSSHAVAIDLKNTSQMYLGGVPSSSSAYPLSVAYQSFPFHPPGAPFLELALTDVFFAPCQPLVIDNALNPSSNQIYLS